jgi:hypothetical protein
MGVVQERKRARETVKEKIVRTPGWVSYRREIREKREERS